MRSQAMLWYPSNQFVMNSVYKYFLIFCQRSSYHGTKEVSGINFNSYFLGVCLTLLALTVNFCISLQLFPLMLVCMTMTFGQISPEDCIIMHLRMTIFLVKVTFPLSFRHLFFFSQLYGMFLNFEIQLTQFLFQFKMVVILSIMII